MHHIKRVIDWERSHEFVRFLMPFPLLCLDPMQLVRGIEDGPHASLVFYALPLREGERDV